MDAFIVLLVVIIIICFSCYKRSVQTAAYGIAAFDLLLRILNFVARNVKIKEVSSFFAPWPNSLLSVMYKYTRGMVYDILSWSFVLLMIYFLVLTLIIFFKK